MPTPLLVSLSMMVWSSSTSCSASDGGGLIHLDDARVVADRLGDLDHLLLGDGQEPHSPGRSKSGDAELGEESLGVTVHLGGVDEAATTRLPPEVDVLGDRALGQEVELLEHRGQAGLLGLDRVAEGNLVAVQLDRPLVSLVDAGEDLHERRLAGSVLPDDAEHLAGMQLEISRREAPETRRSSWTARSPSGAFGPRRCRALAHCGTRHSLLSRLRQKLILART